MCAEHTASVQIAGLACRRGSKALNTAWTKITAAQKANEFDLGGHAAKAKDAIKLAQDELKAAAETSNEKK